MGHCYTPQHSPLCVHDHWAPLNDLSALVRLPLLHLCPRSLPRARTAHTQHRSALQLGAAVHQPVSQQHHSTL
jgi:hypothetical protein